MSYLPRHGLVWFHLGIASLAKIIWIQFLVQIYDYDRDYQEVGVARFTKKYFVVRNCLPNAKSDMLLSPWNPPPDWGKYVFPLMLISFC